MVRSLIRTIVLLSLPVWVARAILQERFSVAFQLGKPSANGLLRALVYGLAYLGCVAGFLYLLQGSLDPSLPTGLGLWLLVIDVFVEEALCRGFLLTQLRRELTFARANALAALTFLLAHSRMLFGVWSQGEYVGADWRVFDDGRWFALLTSALSVSAARTHGPDGSRAGYTALDLRLGVSAGAFPLALRPLLDHLHGQAEGRGRVIQHAHPNKDAEHGFPPIEDLSTNLCEHLRRAGVTRADLFEQTATTKNITFYDLRATGIPWEALAGTDPSASCSAPGTSTLRL